MVDNSRGELRRMDHEQTSQYKRTLAFVIFIILALVMITATFLNPLFMKGQIRTSNNRAVIVRQVNSHFNTLAELIGAKQEDDSNLLTVQESEPIADQVIDYSLGLHWFKMNSLPLAEQILTTIDKSVDQGASSGAQAVRKRLKKEGSNAAYLVAQAFNLQVVALGANIATLLLIVNVIIVVITIITLLSLISDMRSRSSTKALVHDVTAAGMWAGFWLILINGLLALIPVVFNVETLQLADLGFLMEIASGVFLEFVIVGVVLYIICAIPWQITTAN
ncbi:MULTISPECIES: hypothetical protein [Lactobacillus]|uniref:Uncharacterized protein n=1 Tax=Lactobacillus xujianguonis TaxID=2495899 RepID=A0A437SVV1_9LACO|nr:MULTISPECIES: hypothetical protein [Lactobacillus]RVU71055.1 hypothetical protein EJK17_04165 [Lactobacillus xujianguonis]RVU76789.1 hypothetical protein EJK20_03960 [Lactobacillus xujianguonis]